MYLYHVFQNLPNGLKAAASRGLIATFMTLCRKCPVSRLSKADEVGLTAMHHAAMWNRPQIITILILQSMDVNVRRSNHFLSQGMSLYYGTTTLTTNILYSPLLRTVFT